MAVKKSKGLIAVAIIIVILIILIATSYNSMVRKQEKVNQQWSEVQNTYQRRLDLIPNLVNVVKGVSGFEQTTLEKLALARSRAQSAIGNSDASAENYNRQAGLQDSLAAAANRVIAVIEDYPNLKGTSAYKGLQVQLEGTETRIKVARNDFNAAVADYNNKVRSFPSSIVAGILGFKKKEGFVADAGTEKATQIKF
jgi:LemA protein